MPHIIVKMTPGRSPETKRRVADAVAKAVMAETGVKDEALSVSIEDIADDDWMEKVY